VCARAIGSSDSSIANRHFAKKIILVGKTLVRISKHALKRFLSAAVLTDTRRKVFQMTHMLNGSQVAFNIAPVVIADTSTFRERCAAFDDSQVDAMVVQIEESVARRDAASDNGGLSWSNSRKLIEKNKIALARFFLALNLHAANVIENRLVSSALFNAKALKKVVELAKFAVTGSKEIEKVLSCFIICALAFDARTGDAISNRFNKSFLSSLSFDKLNVDAELAEYLADYQHKYMTGGKDTQSSQARRVLEVLGLAEIVNCENRSRGGIALKSDHAFFADFASAFTK
jgi:hypothetical protein